MKKIILLTSICWLVLIVGCSKQDYYNIPLGADGRAVITQVSKATSPGITVLDPSFTVDIQFATATAGDVMVAEIVQLRLPTAEEGGGTTKQLLPLTGSKKSITVGADLKATVTYTRAEANLVAAGDYVKVTFSGKTDAGILRVDLRSATTVGTPKYSTKNVTLMRIPDAAMLSINVAPVAAYTGAVTVTRKNGTTGTWVSVGSFAATDNVPISGADFAVGNDTMFYKVSATQAGNTEEVTTKVVVATPSFFFRKTGVTLAAGGTSAGRNLLNNAAVAETAATATLGLTVSGGVLSLQGGSAWLTAGKTIQFVASTSAMYDSNKSADAIAAFAAGTPVTTIDPNVAPGIYIFKIIDGADTYYGMLKVTAIVPGVSATIEYRIGNQYAHLLTVS